MLARGSRFARVNSLLKNWIAYYSKKHECFTIIKWSEYYVALSLVDMGGTWVIESQPLDGKTLAHGYLLAPLDRLTLSLCKHASSAWAKMILLYIMCP